MKKKSRKQRKSAKERELKKSLLAKSGYKKHKKRRCRHYSWNIEGGYFHTYLVKIKNGVHKCSGCDKIFNDEQAQQIEALCKYITTPGIKTVKEVKKLLTQDIMPNEYYYATPNEKVLCSTVEITPESLVEDYENNRMKTKTETLEYLEILIKKAGNGTLRAKAADEIFGKSRSIISDLPCYSWDSYVHYPHYQTEKLIETLKYSETVTEAYEKIGKLLSFSNSTSERMSEFENIFYREDCFEYLLQKDFDRESAYDLMETVSREVCIPYYRLLQHERFFTRSEKLSNEFYEWAETVRYLPSRRLVFVIFFEQDEIN